MKYTDDHKKEVLSQVPLEVPFDAKRPETLNEQIARLVKTHWSQMASDNDKETYDEANDFGDDDVDDFDYMPTSPFEEEYFDAPQVELEKKAADDTDTETTEKPKRGRKPKDVKSNVDGEALDDALDDNA